MLKRDKNHINLKEKHWNNIICRHESKKSHFEGDGIKYSKSRIKDLPFDCITCLVKYLEIAIWSCIIPKDVGRICMTNVNINVQKVHKRKDYWKSCNK